MKKLQNKILSLLGRLLIPIIFFCCHKAGNTSRTYSGTHTGKVLYNTCGKMVIHAIDGSGIGQNGWTDSNSLAYPVYNNVFKVANPIQFSADDTIHISIGDTVNFQFTTPITNIYLWCNIAVYTPDTVYIVKRVL